MQYHRWEHDRQKKDNNQYRMNASDEYLFFEVPGAGDICISKNCHHSTGEVVGFGFGVEWGRYGFCGGVLGREEAKRLAEFIITECSTTTETMQEERERRKLERQKWAQEQETSNS